MTTDETDRFKEKRDAALLTMDINYMRRQFPHGSDEALIIALHKVRYEMLSLPDVARHESGEWLRKSGYSRFGNLPLLPQGQLPHATPS